MAFTPNITEETLEESWLVIVENLLMIIEQQGTLIKDLEYKNDKLRNKK